MEQIVFEVNYNTGQWKKLRRKLKTEIKDAPPQPAAAAPLPEPQQ